MKSYVSLKSKYEARKIYRKIGICPKRFDSPMSCACFHIGVFGLHYGLLGIGGVILHQSVNASSDSSFSSLRII